MTDWNLITNELSQRPSLAYGDRDQSKKASLIKDDFKLEQNVGTTDGAKTHSSHWRPALMKNRLRVAEPVANAGGETREAPRANINSDQEIEQPEVIHRIKPNNADSSKGLVDFEVFDGSGQPKDIDNSSGSDNGFDQPAEGFIANQGAEQQTATPKKTIGDHGIKPAINPNVNRERATAALNDTQINKNENLSLVPNVNAEEENGNDEAISVEANIEDNQIPNRSDAVQMTNKVDRPEAPEITITSVEDPVNVDIKAKTDRSEPPVATDPTVVPIRVEKTEQLNSVEKPVKLPQPQEETTDGTVQPAGETMVPATESEGQKRIDAAKKEIFGGGKKFDQMVEEERRINQENVIAPVPEKPGVQQPQSQQPKVHIDGQPGVIGEIKPKENITEDGTTRNSANTENLGAHDYALRIGPNATANQFAELLKRRHNNLGDEQLKQAA